MAVACQKTLPETAPAAPVKVTKTTSRPASRAPLRARSAPLTIQVAQLPTHLNPLLPDADEWTDRIALHNVFETLTRIEEGKVRLHLLESVVWKEDRRRVLLRLRGGVTFHDGRPLTARDAFFTLHHILRFRSINPLLKARLDSIRKVLELSKHVLELRLYRHDERLLTTLADVPIVPAHRYRRAGLRSSRQNRTPIGTGPFRVVPSAREHELVLQRNKDYWGPLPYLPRVVFRQMSDPGRALMALRNGEIDVVPSVYVGYYPKQLEDRRFKRRFRVVRVYPQRMRVLLFNCSKRPFKDRRARLAVAHLVDRPRLVRMARNDLATVISGPIMPTSNWYDRNLHPRSIDLARAGRLFHQAGWVRWRRWGRHWVGHPLHARLIYADDDGAKALASAIVKDLEAGHVKVSAQALPLAQLNRALHHRNFDIALFGLALDPSLDLSPFLHSKGMFNYGQFDSNAVDALLDGMRRLPPTTDRVRLGRRLHRALHEELPLLVLFQPIELMAMHRRVLEVGQDGHFPLLTQLRIVGGAR